MAKKEAKPAEGAETEGADGEDAGAPKKRFGKMFLLMAAGGALVLLLALGGGAYFFFSGSSHDKSKMAGGPTVPLVAPQVTYFDMPDLVVNIQSADGTPAYLKLSVALELDSPEEKAGIQILMPRVIDQFQGYLRELRIDDLHGSAGVVRLKEELLRRVNVAAAPFPVHDVLLKEMIVQ
ncbi:MAG: flagellar basal body-associated FliL family protein [Rhizomicrobium sp.]|jgi:flagellar FliL protein